MLAGHEEGISTDMYSETCVLFTATIHQNLEYRYSNHDIWPEDVATVVMCIFLYPGRHNIRPTYKTSREVYK